jgi:hypothetical protein
VYVIKYTCMHSSFKLAGYGYKLRRTNEKRIVRKKKKRRDKIQDFLSLIVRILLSVGQFISYFNMQEYFEAQSKLLKRFQQETGDDYQNFLTS